MPRAPVPCVFWRQVRGADACEWMGRDICEGVCKGRYMDRYRNYTCIETFDCRNLQPYMSMYM